MYSGVIDLDTSSDGPPIIRGADPAVTMSIGLLVQLAALGVVTVTDGQVVLAGNDPAGDPVRVVYTIADAWPATNPAIEEGGWLHLLDMTRTAA